LLYFKNHSKLFLFYKSATRAGNNTHSGAGLIF
jgi:hypothetical protein